ncbi:MAG: peptidylprolyl isomerase [Rubricella sp.]
MLGSMRSSKNSLGGWFIIVILVLAMAGFGLGEVLSGGRISTVAEVGDEEVTVDDFARAFQTRVRGVSEQIGTPINTQQARSFGLDQVVLGELIRAAAIDGEAAEAGISMPDEVVQRLLLEEPAFQDAGGNFDADFYRLALENTGLNAAEYEERLRAEGARSLIAGAIAGDMPFPRHAAVAILAYAAERRGAEFVRLSPAAFLDEVGTPTTADLEAHLSDNADRFQVPETRTVSYAVLTLEGMAEGLAPDEETLRDIYDAQIDRFRRPERRIVSRVAFPDDASAEAAAAALAAGELTLEAIAEERGLSATDFQMGAVTRGALGGAAGDAVFDAAELGVVGPVRSDLGPTVFVVNAILAAQELSFEVAREQIAQEEAEAAAADLMFDELLRAEELVAGGATVEDIAAETAFTAGSATVSVDGGSSAISSLPEFVSTALAADPGVETDPVEAETGEIFVLRVDDITPPRVPPLAEIRDAVEEDWRRSEAARLAREAADEAMQSDEADLETLATVFESPVETLPALSRDQQPDGLPSGLVPALFDLEEGQFGVVSGEGGAVLFRLTEIQPFDPGSETGAEVISFLQADAGLDLQNDMLAYFTSARSDERGLRVNQGVINQILAQIP